ncbi:AraC family transcriptional regulator [Rapidithrix thailandica]|uniref:AraC family transcriptional regulator n=1 Tax=Rapidithrix thailandica TaxID=413964 RepID=A0AAW9SIK5_9BACT
MSNQTQLDRFKAVTDFLRDRFKDDITAKDVEEIAYYSYRNINRIFRALQHETIGQYIKRLKLEKAAEYLKYSDAAISDIALDIGYSDIAAFSKAFKNQFQCSPLAFREVQHLKLEITQKASGTATLFQTPELPFEIEELPVLEVLYLEYQGAYENLKGIQDTWNQLIAYAHQQGLLTADTLYLAEILDDDEITDSLNCRLNTAIVLEKPLSFPLEGFFKTKPIESQKYVKFVHKGSHETCMDTYDSIYAQWMVHVQKEFADKPILEFYVNDEADTPKEELLTEIHIPILA